MFTSIQLEGTMYTQWTFPYFLRLDPSQNLVWERNLGKKLGKKLEKLNLKKGI